MMEDESKHMILCPTKDKKGYHITYTHRLPTAHLNPFMIDLTDVGQYSIVIPNAFDTVDTYKFTAVGLVPSGETDMCIQMISNNCLITSAVGTSSNLLTPGSCEIVWMDVLMPLNPLKDILTNAGETWATSDPETRRGYRSGIEYKYMSTAMKLPCPSSVVSFKVPKRTTMKPAYQYLIDNARRNSISCSVTFSILLTKKLPNVDGPVRTLSIKVRSVTMNDV